VHLIGFHYKNKKQTVVVSFQGKPLIQLAWRSDLQNDYSLVTPHKS